ncbi:MAG: c-type cytochrome [Pirellula sp.]|jgi:mono/diheme cytochrome c family protein
MASHVPLVTLNTTPQRFLRLVPRTTVILLIFVMAGCGPTKIEYRPNELYAVSLHREQGDAGQTESKESSTLAAALVERWFGTADLPIWPSELLVGVPGVDDVVRMDDVERSAGPVGRGNDKIERGLYRKHCVPCHSVTGDGRGLAASMLSPYPRDFRRGTFKFKSTPTGVKPTRADLVRTLHDGIPGTSMPSFAALELSKEFQNDIESLVEYVRFLSIRGEVERRLIAKHARGESQLNADDESAIEVVRLVVANWGSAEAKVVPIPTPPKLNAEQFKDSAKRGEEWFRSELTACAKCHGAGGVGDGVSQDFDDWTKDWTLLAGIDPKHKSDWKEMKPFGALKPVIDKPRNLAWGAFHGGGDRQDLFRRLVLGIEGTPMPPIARAVNGNPGLTDDEIWDLVHYVQSLSGVASAKSAVDDTTSSKTEGAAE